MANQSTVHLGANSPEKIAYDLMEAIMQVERVTLDPDPSDTSHGKS
jgi:hypothetical protein